MLLINFTDLQMHFFVCIIMLKEKLCGGESSLRFVRSSFLVVFVMGGEVFATQAPDGHRESVSDAEDRILFSPRFSPPDPYELIRMLDGAHISKSSGTGQEPVKRSSGRNHEKNR